VKDYYKIAIGMLGISPTYFLDDMSFEAFELSSEGYYQKQKAGWEQTRILSYYSISPYLKQNMTAEQILPLLWDNEKSNKKVVSKEDKKRLFETAKEQYGL